MVVIFNHNNRLTVFVYFDFVDIDVMRPNSLASRSSFLPWSTATRTSLAATIQSGFYDPQASGDNSLRPGEIVMRTLFADFTEQAEKKIENLMVENAVSYIDIID